MRRTHYRDTASDSRAPSPLRTGMFRILCLSKAHFKGELGELGERTSSGAQEKPTLRQKGIVPVWAPPADLYQSWSLSASSLRAVNHHPQARARHLPALGPTPTTLGPGILVCVGGLGMLVASDNLTGTEHPAASMVKEDLFMLAEATLYGFTNATEEFLVRKRPLYEVVGQLGMYGMTINAIGARGLQHKETREANWNGAVSWDFTHAFFSPARNEI
ncbi:hypothetical protein RSOLAG22IIIB_08208 [Rhizoctonia solani]|uniref:Uncharacterized protein n=1 Tax=Rhizoctonia solani TaxID=456999 RepID=A0A0K6FSJ0_9AGAM|nr:hypothetical protein RSOLAG22IIIB_08208 [Rhizoctonia solani]